MPAENLRFCPTPNPNILSLLSAPENQSMASQYPPELDDDSVAPSPRSDQFHDPPSRVRFMCSFGGKILPRPHDNQLRYVGGDTRIVAVNRSISFAALLHKLSKLSGKKTSLHFCRLLRFISFFIIFLKFLIFCWGFIRYRNEQHNSEVSASKRRP